MFNRIQKECVKGWTYIREKKMVLNSAVGLGVFAANMFHYNRSPIHQDEEAIMKGYKIVAMSAIKAVVYGYIAPLACVVMFLDSLSNDKRMFMRHVVPLSIHGNPENGKSTYSIHIQYGKSHYYFGSDTNKDEIPEELNF